MAAVPTSVTASKPLEAGMRLSRAEFHALYLAHPEIQKAELVDGVVYMPSPVSKFHSPHHAVLSHWLASYAEPEPSLLTEDNITTFLPGESEVQPDCVLWRDGGRASYNDDGYLHGAPELIAEVAASSKLYDLGAKKELYRRAGVQEYVVWRTRDGAIDWWRLDGGAYVPIRPGARGMTESLVFPGLRLEIPRLLSGDKSRIMADLQP